MARGWIMAVTAAVFVAATGSSGFALDANAVNRADVSEIGNRPDVSQTGSARAAIRAAKNGKDLDPVIIKAEVLLDRAHFSPGEIDGRDGENFHKAIAAFESAQGMNVDGKLSPDLWARLTTTSNGPVVGEYTISDNDVKGPFVNNIPAHMEDMKDLDYLGYRGPVEALAEKFHMSEALLKALNPGKQFRAGETIVVAKVRTEPPAGKAAKIEVDKASKVLRVIGQDGQLLAVYPASIGSVEKPAPSGLHKVTAIARNPTYKYNPAYHFKGVKANRPFTIKPGPNNPVGTVWINLTGEGYGIHGTPDPSKVSKTSSHGCVRLTNWDANELAGLVDKGTPVAFLDEGSEAMASAAPDDASPRNAHRSSRPRRR